MALIYKLRYILTPLFLLPICATAQGYQSVGARSGALASTSVTLEDVWAYHHNPGALASLKTFSAGAYYETRFLAKELQTQAIAVAIPLKKGVVSVGGQFFGYQQYRNTRAGLGYSLQLSEKIAAGVQINLQQLKLGGNYGSSSNATFEAGILAAVSEKWKLGASVANVGRQRIRPLEEDRFTTVLRIGSRYMPSKKVNVLLEVEKQVISDFSFKGAIEYFPVEAIVIRFGAHSGPTEFAFGVGYKSKKGISIDVGSKYHQVLGFSPNVGLTYQLPTREIN